MAVPFPLFDTFDITVAGTVHDVYRYGSAQAESAHARILLFPDFEGAQSKGAARLAQAYSETCNAEVFLTDLYGKRHKPNGYDQRADSVITHARAHPLETRRRLCQINAALSSMWCSSAPLIVIGFCFGGTLAFELARADPSIAAAVSIHGDPSTIAPLAAAATGASFITIIGANDPLISGESVSSFVNEANVARIRWQMLTIGDARHSFTKKELLIGNWAMRYDSYADELARMYINAIVTMYSASSLRH